VADGFPTTTLSCFNYFTSTVPISCFTLNVNSFVTFTTSFKNIADTGLTTTGLTTRQQDEHGENSQPDDDSKPHADAVFLDQIILVRTTDPQLDIAGLVLTL
jgi:hypothetical protein